MNEKGDARACPGRIHVEHRFDITTETCEACGAKRWHSDGQLECGGVRLPKPGSLLDGFIVGIYRSEALGDCSMAGVSSLGMHLWVVGDEIIEAGLALSKRRLILEGGWARGTAGQLFGKEQSIPAVTVLRRGQYPPVLIPLGIGGPGVSMAGGCYAGSHDSRWSRLVGNHGSLMAVHDRIEDVNADDRVARIRSWVEARGLSIAADRTVGA